MRVRQRAYFRIASVLLSPDEITRLAGVEPDSSAVKGSRPNAAGLPLPKNHLWRLESGVSEEADLESHFVALMPRLRAGEAGFRIVTRQPETWASLTVVRYFEPGEEDFDEATFGLPEGSPFERLSGQHPFLGWFLDDDVVQLLASIGAAIDVDEYG